jgi:hypothetical protein
MYRAMFHAFWMIGLSLAAACGTDADEPATSGAALRAHAQANPTFAGDIKSLADAGWTVTPLAAAQIDQLTGPAAGADSATSPADIVWWRIRLTASLPSTTGAAPLYVELLLATAEGQDDSVAIRPYSDAAEAAALAVLEGNRAPAGLTLSPHLAIGSPCHSQNDCGSSGLTCFGPDNHETCQCSSTNTFSSSVTTNKASGAPACRSEDDPSGGFHDVSHYTGCGQALTADVCGNTRVKPAWVTHSSVSIVCGFNC